MNKKFILGIAASAALAVVSVLPASAAGFSKTASYTPGMFTDVPANEWYASSVSSSYELGFMKGTADGVFEPEGNITVAEAVTIAARVHDAYNGKGTQFSQNGANWYDEYVSYAVANGIITADQFDSYERPAKRYEMAVVFSNAVPDSYLEARNNVTEIPDVPETNAYFGRLQLLYNAGVVMGNDAFGTFMPNNNITRAEAAAIINRVALPENRLQRTLIDANYDDAYYLVNHGVNWGLSETSTNYDSPWQYDNRNRIGAISNSANNIADYYTDGKIELWRDVDNVSRGLIGWDFTGSLSMAENGIYFKLTDDELNEVCNLSTKDGKFVFNGTDTGVAVPGGTVYFTMKVDLDDNTAELYVGGVKVGGTYPAGDYTVSRMYIGSGKETTGTVSITKCDLYKDYVVNDIFLVPVGSKLAQWEVSGTAEVARTGGQGYGDYNSAQLTAGTTAKKSFKQIAGSVVFETYMLFPTAADTGYISLNSGDTSVAKLVVNADGVFKADGTKLRHHTNNIWQCLRIEADTTTGTVLYKVNGKKVGEFALDAAALSVDNITVGATGGTVFFDDAQVYLTHEYDDYCPTPVPVTDDGYDVILNICSLWREGTHFGWGAVSGFPDIEPALGYYDEGLAEVADWEIKFMVENGIDVQHLCWYCPSSDIQEPIKKSNMNNALHDGFFNAEYSDMMKFTFMWENSGVNAQNLEQFKTYIWNYWMDYYFLDERFYTIDNKIVFTAWSWNNFKKAFGGTNEGCLEAIEFMNEDAKAHGFDGVMIFFADGHAQDAATFASMAAIGATGSYAYHWNQDGISADATTKRLQRNQDYGKLHIVPTVSVGFNNVGWSGVRKDLASLQDHRTVLEYIKNTYLPKAEGWKSKTLIVSTWNEYGEGTYVMPCAGLHGFGYLENVAEVISGVTDHSNNIYPTE
ncbi:MAG: S-layer homology domain-containing protein, partial [Eubacteriales bacterium]